MKTMIIYSSQTGFTKRYAEWIAKELDGEILPLKEAKNKPDSYFEVFDAIVYGGWNMGGKIVDADWFFSKASGWKQKKLAVYCVGASPVENPGVEKVLSDLLTEEQKKYIKAFYCPGGLDYAKMKLPSKLMLKALSSMLNKKKDATEEEKKMAEMLSKSYDISEPKYAVAVADYLK